MTDPAIQKPRPGGAGAQAIIMPQPPSGVGVMRTVVGIAFVFAFWFYKYILPKLDSNDNDDKPSHYDIGILVPAINKWWLPIFISLVLFLAYLKKPSTPNDQSVTRTTELEGMLHVSQKRVEIAADAIASLQSRIASLDKNKHDLLEKQSDVARQNLELSGQLDEAKSKLTTSISRLTKLRKRLSQTNQEEMSQKQRLRGLENQLTSISKADTKKQKEIVGLRSKMEKLTAQTQTQQYELEQALEKNEELTTQEAHLTNLLNQSHQTNQKKDFELLSLRKNIDFLSACKAELVLALSDQSNGKEEEEKEEQGFALSGLREERSLPGQGEIFNPCLPHEVGNSYSVNPIELGNLVTDLINVLGPICQLKKKEESLYVGLKGDQQEDPTVLHQDIDIILAIKNGTNGTVRSLTEDEFGRLASYLDSPDKSYDFTTKFTTAGPSMSETIPSSDGSYRYYNKKFLVKSPGKSCPIPLDISLYTARDDCFQDVLMDHSKFTRGYGFTEIIIDPTNSACYLGNRQTPFDLDEIPKSQGELNFTGEEPPPLTAKDLPYLLKAIDRARLAGRGVHQRMQTHVETLVKSIEGGPQWGVYISNMTKIKRIFEEIKVESLHQQVESLHQQLKKSHQENDILQSRLAKIGMLLEQQPEQFNGEGYPEGNAGGPTLNAPAARSCNPAFFQKSGLNKPMSPYKSSRARSHQTTADPKAAQQHP